MSPGRVELRVSLWPALAAFVMLAATLRLGIWQLDRAAQKSTLQAAQEAAGRLPPMLLSGTQPAVEALQFRAVEVVGEYQPARQIFIDNKVEQGNAGYYVLTPLQIEGSARYVLVNRGWVPRAAEYPLPPTVPVPAGRRRVLGYGALPATRFLELSGETVQGPVWQNLTFERYRRITGLDVVPLIVEQSRPDSSGMTPVREAPAAGIAMHQGYALQWFSLAAAIVVIFVWRCVRWRS